MKREELEQVRKPMSTSKQFFQQTMDELAGLIESSALDTRVALVRDLLDRDGEDWRVSAPAARTTGLAPPRRKPTWTLGRRWA